MLADLDAAAHGEIDEIGREAAIVVAHALDVAQDAWRAAVRRFVLRDDHAGFRIATDARSIRSR